jgi:ribosomal protein S18 acetylase RimI-like enzyme
MIRELESTQLDDIDPIIDRFREQSAEGAIPDNFEEQLKDAVIKDRGCLYGCFAEDGSILGIGFFGKGGSRIPFVYADGNLDLEKELVNTLFDRFSKESSFLVTGGPWISDTMSQHILDIGFMKFNRAYMTLPRTNLEALQEPTLPEGMKFDVYTSEMKDETTDLMFKGNNGHVDQNVFPDFFGSPEDCQRLIENIEAGRYGEYKESSSWILSENGKVIGVCFMTIRNGDTGYIPDIVIDPAYRGRGLGKAIQVHSMKRQIESESSLVKVDLDVTLTNNARFLYDSLGFESVREYTIYTWQK